MATESNEYREQLRRRRIRQLLRRVSTRTIAYTQAIVAAGGLLVIVMLRIPWLASVLKRIGFSDFGIVVQTVIVIVLVSIFFDVRVLLERTDQIPDEQRHCADPMAVYPLLQERMEKTTRQEEKRLDILGISLYTAWPSIRFWLDHPELNGWTVRLTAVAHRDRRLAEYVPLNWFRESRTNLDDIHETAQRQTFKERRITIEAYGYDFMPVLHGYRIGNGDLFYSILSWQSDGKMGRDGYSYEYVPATDKSASAQAIREIWDAWFRRAMTTPWHPNSAR
jgi:hypothetical protein